MIPIGMSAVALFSGPAVECNGLQATILGEAAHLHIDMLVIVPSAAEFAGQRDTNGGSNLSEKGFDQRQVAEQARASVTLDHFFDGTAEINIDGIKTDIFTGSGGVGHHLRVAAKELGGDGAFGFFEGEIPHRKVAFDGGARRFDDAVGTGELGHEQAAAALMANELPEDGVGDPGHGCQDSGRADGDGPDRKGIWHFWHTFQFKGYGGRSVRRMLDGVETGHGKTALHK